MDYARIAGRISALIQASKEQPTTAEIEALLLEEVEPVVKRLENHIGSLQDEWAEACTCGKSAGQHEAECGIFYRAASVRRFIEVLRCAPCNARVSLGSSICSGHHPYDPAVMMGIILIEVTEKLKTTVNKLKHTGALPPRGVADLDDLNSWLWKHRKNFLKTAKSLGIKR